MLRREEEILPELARVASENLGRERLVGLHMRALYQAGRRVEALDVYTRTRIYLSDELGIDPGPELRELHHAILRDEPAAPRAVPSAIGSRPEQASTSLIVPRQLPADVLGFTGRAEDLNQLDHLLHDRDDASASVVISAIGGNAGVGKTALAVHWGHRVADRFPDGQLFIDLRGFTSGVAPVATGDALDRLLRALGVPGNQIPTELDDRAALWRSVLAGRRMLIVLDNAATETQVAPMLPGLPGSLVLVTSRRRLAGLDATHTVSLNALPKADALKLFDRTAGHDQLAGQPRELIAETVELCGRLPLAIRIAGARLRSHPVWSISDLVERFRDEDQRLAELEDGQRSVASALDVSYHQLTPEQQRMYRLLGLHPGPDIEPYAAAALVDVSFAQARRCLDQLLNVHLLQEPAACRFAFHDLVRAHAAGTATAADARPVLRAARRRLLDHYRHTASVAMDVAYPYERGRAHVVVAATPSPDLSDPTQAIGWLDGELPNLLAAARDATNDIGTHTHVLDLSSILYRHLRTSGLYRDAETLHHQALTTARATGHRAGEVDALAGLARVHDLQGRHEHAADHYEQALLLARAAGYRTGVLAR